MAAMTTVFGTGEGSASDEPEPGERVSSGAPVAAMTTVFGTGEGSASDEPEPDERVSSEEGH
jgi:hypothetical protein